MKAEFVFYSSPFVDIDGKAVRRTPYSHPYNYDTYVLHKSSSFNKKSDYVVDSDRMMSRNLNLFGESVKAAGRTGQLLYNITLEEASLLLSRYYGQDLVCTCILENCNQSSGYPYWTFFYKEVK